MLSMVIGMPLSVKPNSLNVMDDALLDGDPNACVLTMRRDIARKR